VGLLRPDEGHCYALPQGLCEDTAKVIGAWMRRKNYWLECGLTRAFWTCYTSGRY